MPRPTPAATFWTGVVLVAVGIVGYTLAAGRVFDTSGLRLMIFVTDVLQSATILGIVLVGVSLVLQRLEPARTLPQPEAQPTSGPF
ncbi:hypothetical protein [Cellulomonas sp. HZM]|uniref:hypothetical protein n=1 Tax=Cellulomonas sp. HZM TaxID=1454010 RepID=UPI0012DC82E7|nr:hypothetical protein [Cellulomonas sp. HZM]